MDIGIVGLGLIGGSLAKAFTDCDGISVWGSDMDHSVAEKAAAGGTISGILTDSKLAECDHIIIALYPQAAIDFIRSNHSLFKKDAVIMDTCGVKEAVCSEIFPLARKEGFTFVGTHPMAGIEKSGFENSFGDLFRGASMILVPDGELTCNDQVIGELTELFKNIGFGRIEITTASEHDKMIAYTSQLAHVVSSAYIKNPFAMKHRGFSAGSFHDMTRVAKLNEGMWTELFLDNRENLVDDIDRLMDELAKYREAISKPDKDELLGLLRDGREIREGLTGNDGN